MWVDPPPPLATQLLVRVFRQVQFQGAVQCPLSKLGRSTSPTSARGRNTFASRCLFGGGQNFIWDAETN